MLAKDHDDSGKADDNTKYYGDCWFFIFVHCDVDQDYPHRHERTNDRCYSTRNMNFSPRDKSVPHREHKETSNCLLEDLFLWRKLCFANSQHECHKDGSCNKLANDYKQEWRKTYHGNSEREVSCSPDQADCCQGGIR